MAPLLIQNQNVSPFYLMMGYNPRAIPTVPASSDIPSVEKRLSDLMKARDEAAAAHEVARQKMAERITKGFTPFTQGQKVWLEATHLRFPTPSKKMSPKRVGPLTITEFLVPLTYRPKLPYQ